MSQTCLAAIRSTYARLSEKEKRIASYILENPDKIIHSTINEVAEALLVADATVFRFCKRIGFKGYQAMKIALASEVRLPAEQMHGEIDEGDDEKTIAEKIFKSNIRTLEYTLGVLNEKDFALAVHFLAEAKTIHFYGTGGSAAVALDACHKFMRTGIQASAFMDSHLQRMSAARLTPEDTAVVISHSGTNKDTIEILDNAIESGARTVAITSFPKSPLGQKAGVSLITSSLETEYRSEALASRIGQLSLIDALFVNIVMHNKERARDALEKIRGSISETRVHL